MKHEPFNIYRISINVHTCIVQRAAKAVREKISKCIFAFAASTETDQIFARLGGIENHTRKSLHRQKFLFTLRISPQHTYCNLHATATLSTKVEGKGKMAFCIKKWEQWKLPWNKQIGEIGTHSYGKPFRNVLMADHAFFSCCLSKRMCIHKFFISICSCGEFGVEFSGFFETKLTK